VKFFIRLASSTFALVTFSVAISLSVAAQTTTPKSQTLPAPAQTSPAAPTQTTANSAQASMSERERRAKAYAKLMQGQRFFTNARGAGGISREDLRAAQQSFEQAATLDPTLSEAHTALAEIAFFFLDDQPLAEREATTAVRIDNNNFGAHRILSRLFALKAGLGPDKLDRAAADRAIAALREVLRLDPTDAEALALLGEFYAKTGREREAIDAFRSWMGAPATVDTNFYKVITQGRELSSEAAAARLAEALSNAGRTDEALAAYEELLKARGIPPTSDQPLTADSDREFARNALQNILNVQRQAGRTNDALNTLERMRRLTGANNPQFDFYSIELLREQGKRREALEAARAARLKYPALSEFLRLEAETLAALGQVEEGATLLRARLSGKLEDDYPAYLSITNLYLQAGRGKEAVETARKLLALTPPDQPQLVMQSLFMLSSAQERAGDTKGAEESLRRVLAKDPNNATALNNLGYFLTERNERLPEALDMIKRAVEAEPTNSSFLDSLGWVYFKLGQLDEAERHLTDAARRSTRSATIQEHLGDLHQKRGQLEQARAAWRKALSLTVDASESARLKAKIEGDARK